MSVREQLSRNVEEFLNCRKAEEHPNGRVHQLYERPSIMISRQAGTGGLEIATKLVDYLTQFDETAEHGWALFDQSLLADVIEKGSLPDVVREYVTPTDSDTAPHKMIKEMQASSPSEWTLFQHSADTVRRLCRLGNVIILGRGANFLTQDLPNAFHVRLVGDPKCRVRNLVQSLGLSPEEANAYLVSTDRARSDYVERHLERSLDDPASYHLTLNVSRIGNATSAHIIGDSLIEWAGSRSLPVLS